MSRGSASRHPAAGWRHVSAEPVLGSAKPGFYAKPRKALCALLLSWTNRFVL